MAGFRFINCENLEGKPTLKASGLWVSHFVSDIEKEIEALKNQIANRLADKARPLAEKDFEGAFICIDASEIKDIDTYGAWLLERIKRDYEQAYSELGARVEIRGLSSEDLSLFEVIKDANLKEKDGPQGGRFAQFALRSQLAIYSIGLDLLSFANMLGALTISLFKVIKNPLNFRFTSAVHQLDKVGWQALPIIILITLLIGGIISQQGFFHFSKLGAELYVVDMVGILVLREVGILLVAIMVAGRSGSAYTAELGSMKMREEIDALRTMGLNPIDVLILPRVLMLVCAVPLLTFVGSLAALYGGGLAAWLYGGMSPEIFIQRLKEAISIDHFKVGMIKAPFMGLVIGIVACTEGLKVKGSAESLGQQTTKSVVKAIFMVIVLDGFFAIFFASIGI